MGTDHRAFSRQPLTGRLMSVVPGSAVPRAVLEQLGEAELASQGRLCVVSVQAVRDHSKGRWPVKREAVWEFAERRFRQDFSSIDQILRLDDARYLLVQPETRALAATGRAIAFLREVLEFFLDGVSVGDIEAGRVATLSPAGIDYAPFSQAEIEAAFDSHPPQSEPAAEGAPPPLSSPAGAAGADGVQSLFMTQPIWAVQKNVVASYRLRPLFMGVEGMFQGETLLDGTPTREVVKLDLRVLDHGLELLAGGTRPFGLYVPLHIRTLNSIPGRQAVLARLRRAEVATDSRIAFSIQGLDEGVPRMVLEAAIAALRPLCLGVVASAPSLGTDVTAWRGVPFSAIAFDFNDLALDADGDLSRTLLRFAESASSVCPGLVGYSLTTRARVMAAWTAGFTHLSGDILEVRADTLAAVRFRPEDLYRSLLCA